MPEATTDTYQPSPGRRYRIGPVQVSGLQALGRVGEPSTGDLNDLLVPLVTAERPAHAMIEQLAMDGCLLVAVADQKVLATAGLDLATGAFSHLELTTLAVDRIRNDEDRRWAGDLLRRMVVAVERLAIRFGLLSAQVDCVASAAPRLRLLGYRDTHKAGPRLDPDQGGPLIRLQRSLLGRQTRYSRRIRKISAALGVPHDYGRIHRLCLQDEAGLLQSIGQDIYAREQSMTPGAARAWLQLCDRAAADGVTLQAVSAFRPVAYQQALVVRKLERGQSIEQILGVSAAPGFSEHHSGRAIDITTPGFAVLEEDFADSPAFAWLERHAAAQGFRLSFPRNNRHGVGYEPWHWYFTG